MTIQIESTNLQIAQIVDDRQGVGVGRLRRPPRDDGGVKVPLQDGRPAGSLRRGRWRAADNPPCEVEGKGEAEDGRRFGLRRHGGGHNTGPRYLSSPMVLVNRMLHPEPEAVL